MPHHTIVSTSIKSPEQPNPVHIPKEYSAFMDIFLT